MKLAYSVSEEQELQTERCRSLNANGLVRIRPFDPLYNKHFN
jgi:hypothetical protein